MIPLLIALQFLTRLPVRLPGMPEPVQVGRSLLFYPLVGGCSAWRCWRWSGCWATPRCCSRPLCC